MPILTVVAGPNGSGKSTITAFTEIEGHDRLVNPDVIAFGLNPSDPAAVAVQAGRVSLQQIAGHLAAGLSFAVETTLSGRTNLQLMRDAKTRGYTVHLLYIALDSAERSISRIQNRVARGGHFVPEVDVRRRYLRSIANMHQAIALTDAASIYENSGNTPRLVLVAKAGVVVWRADPLPNWIQL